MPPDDADRNFRPSAPAAEADNLVEPAKPASAEAVPNPDKPGRLLRTWAALRHDPWAYLILPGVALGGGGRFLPDGRVLLNGNPVKLGNLTLLVNDTVVAAGITLALIAGVLNVAQTRREKVAAAAEADQVKVATAKQDAENARLADANRDLEQQVSALQAAIRNSFDDGMFRLHDKLRLGNDGRASVFALTGRGAELVGRYSPNPDFQSAGRGTYPLDGSCLGATARTGSNEVTGLVKVTNTGKAWANQQASRYGMNREQALGLTMKSRSYAGVRLSDAAGKTALGVVIVESLQPDGVSLAALELALASEGRGQGLSEALRTLPRSDQTAADISQKGF